MTWLKYELLLVKHNKHVYYIMQREITLQYEKNLKAFLNKTDGSLYIFKIKMFV